jgi:hypothetical protein
VFSAIVFHCAAVFPGGNVADAGDTSAISADAMSSGRSDIFFNLLSGFIVVPFWMFDDWFRELPFVAINEKRALKVII